MGTTIIFGPARERSKDGSGVRARGFGDVLDALDVTEAPDRVADALNGGDFARLTLTGPGNVSVWVNASLVRYFRESGSL
jgi:hypothetical protein